MSTGPRTYSAKGGYISSPVDYGEAPRKKLHDERLRLTRELMNNPGSVELRVGLYWVRSIIKRKERVR